MTDLNIEKSQDEIDLSEQERDLLNFKLKQKHPVKQRYRAWDAIFAWRDHIFQSTYMRVTKCNYLTGMLKLIESEIINPAVGLKDINERWFDEACSKIDNMVSWSPATKPPRKTCLKSFYKFANNIFNPDYLNDYEMHSYHWIPSPEEMKPIFSCVEEKFPKNKLDTSALIDAMKMINERDCLIICVMIFTGCSLQQVLNLNKEDIKCVKSPYIQFIEKLNLGSECLIKFKDKLKEVPECLIELIIDYTQTNDSNYLFSSADGKPLHRTQVTRNLKLAARNIGVPYELTPKILHGYINAGILRDKTSIVEKLLSHCK